MLPADMRKTEGRAVGHGQGQLKAAKGSHVGGVIRAVPQCSKPNQIPCPKMTVESGRVCMSTMNELTRVSNSAKVSALTPMGAADRNHPP